MPDRLNPIAGGVTAAASFVAGSIYAGIKASNADKPDIAFIYSTAPSVGAGAFTTNKVKAAPVRVSQTHIRAGETRAIVANSGNANACTGAVGIQHARRMTKATAKALGLNEKSVLVCSTGRIGVPLPIEKMEAAIAQGACSLSPDGSQAAAEAIMTSDSFSKEFAVEFILDGKPVRVGGIAKGAGMIDPNMATMLCFITTDAAIEKKLLHQALIDAVEQSFNRITVDGDMSTNDTVLMLANGASGTATLQNGTPGFDLFQHALNTVCRNLSRMIVEDGEGVSKFVTVQVRGAKSRTDARKAAEAVANSTLTKCAWYGGDPNWGRIMDAIGYSTARVREEMVSIYYDGLLAVQNGIAAATPFSKLQEVAAKKTFTITIDLHLGDAEYTVFTTDLTTAYVDFNKGE
jgi:glutamate N-acetyltransferase/amino-acid N-acetyltransferase